MFWLICVVNFRFTKDSLLAGYLPMVLISYNRLVINSDPLIDHVKFITYYISPFCSQTLSPAMVLILLRRVISILTFVSCFVVNVLQL